MERAPKQARVAGAGEHLGRWWGAQLLTQIALVLALAVVIARMTYSDNSRVRSETAPDAPNVAGPAGALGMDLLACVPALLVLARRVSDRQYVLRWSWSILPMLLLAGWGVASVLWAAGKFDAVLGAGQFIGAAALLWAMSQLVRSWTRVRLVASVGCGLLLAIFAHALLFRTIESPDLQRYWNSYVCPDHPEVPARPVPGNCPRDGKPLVQTRQLVFTQHGWSEKDFAAQQFERKVLSGEAQGFFMSANTLAAVAVLLMIIVLGMAAQRLHENRRDYGGIALLLALPAGAWVLFEAKSRTAAVTPLGGAAMLWLAWRYRTALAARASRIFWYGVAALVAGGAAVIGHAMYHGSLGHVSLTFRWFYWVGAMRIVKSHPLLGVGWDNFGDYYLGARLPQAAEEVRDPHNLFVKVLVELGIVGALLCTAWLGRLAWELTRPITPTAPAVARSNQDAGPKAVPLIASICCVAVALNVLMSVDFSFGGAFATTELLRRLNLLGMLLIGTIVAASSSLKTPRLSEAPAPLALYGILAALAAFLLHNLIDFSLFEPGPMLLFAMLAGSALGARQPSVAGKKKNTPIAAAAFAACLVLWLVAGAFVIIPAALAEESAEAAAKATKLGRPNEAVRLYNRAREHMPIEPQYPLKAAAVLMEAAGVDGTALDLLQAAININPMAPTPYLTRARYLFRRGDHSVVKEQIASDFSSALKLNPNDIELRIEYGDRLRGLGEKRAAAQQYREALRLNELLRSDEPRKLRAEAIAELRREVEAAEKTAG